MDNLHYIQIGILRDLLYKDNSKFSEINKNFPSDQFTFHLKQLIRHNLVQKNDDLYRLTPKGLELAGRINTEKGIVIKQPKVSVCFIPIRESEGKQQVLVGKRRREQSIGKYAFFTEKSFLGELFEETCKRGLMKDTGLQGDLTYAGLAHVIRKDESSIEIDVIVIHFKVENLKGEFITSTSDAENTWLNIDDALEIKSDDKVVGFNEILKSTIENKPFFKEYFN